MQTMPTFSGELSCGWNLFAGYTFNCNTCERDINHQGLDFNTYTPKHILRLWPTYRRHEKGRFAAAFAFRIA